MIVFIVKSLLDGPEIAIYPVSGLKLSRIRSRWSVYMCRVGSVGNVSASRTVGREFSSRPGHTKDHHKNGTDCLPA